MSNSKYDPERTGLLLVDPYNDFLSAEGKLWPYAKEVAESVNMLSNLRTIMTSVRQLSIQVFIVPHHRWESSDYLNWKHANPSQLAAARRQSFAKDSWGGTFHDDFQPQVGDVVIKEHWAQSGFANTDLDHQLKAARDREDHPDRHARQYVHRINGSIRHGTRLPRNSGQGRDRSLQPRSDARCPPNQWTRFCTCNIYYQ